MAVSIHLLQLFLLGYMKTSSGCDHQQQSPLNLVLLSITDGASSAAELECLPPSSSCNGRGDAVGCCSEILDAVQLAVDDVNRDCTLLRDYSLTFTHSSTNACGRKEGLDSLHRELFNGSTPDVAVLGAGCSLATEAVAQQSRYYSLPVVSYDSISGHLDDRRQFPYFSRTIPSGDLVAVGVASVLRYYDWRRAVVITEDKPEFTSMTEQLFEELGDYEIDLAEVEIPATPSKLRRPNFLPDGVRVFILHTSETWARLILCNAARSLDWRQRQYVWLTQGWYKARWWEGPAVSNCSSAELQEFLYQQRVLGVSHYPAVNHTAVTVAGRMENGIIHRVDEEEIAFSSTASFAYDAVWSIALGLEATLGELAPLCGNGTTFESFDPLGRDIESRDCVGGLLSDNIDKTTFEGVSGQVSFENGSRRVERLTVTQYRNGSCLPVESLYVLFSTNGEELSLEFPEGESNGTLWPKGVPTDGSAHREVENYPYLWLLVVSYVVNSVVILAALVCLVFTITFHNRKLVKLTSPNLNYLIIAGVIIFTLSTFMFVYPPVSSNSIMAFCSIRIWLVSIGTSLCYGTINAKMFRIFFIFYKVQAKKRVIKDWHLIVFVLILISIDLIILVPTTAAESIRFKPQVVPDMEHPGNFTNDLGTFSYVVSLCDSRGRAPILVFVFGYKALVQAAGITLAVLMRNIRIKVLNDSKEMSLALYLSSVILILVIVISFVFGDRLNVYGGSYSFGVPLSCTAVLVVVFFSKMVRLYQDPNGDRIFANDSTTGGGSGLGPTVPFGGPGNGGKVAELVERVRELEKKIAEQHSKASAQEATTSFSLQNGASPTEADTSLSLKNSGEMDKDGQKTAISYV